MSLSFLIALMVVPKYMNCCSVSFNHFSHRTAILVQSVSTIFGNLKKALLLFIVSHIGGGSYGMRWAQFIISHAVLVLSLLPLYIANVIYICIIDNKSWYMLILVLLLSLSYLHTLTLSCDSNDYYIYSTRSICI